MFEIPNVFEELRLRLWVCIRRVHFLQALLDFVLLTVPEPNPQFLDKRVLEEFDSEGSAVLIENLKEQEPQFSGLVLHHLGALTFHLAISGDPV